MTDDKLNLFGDWNELVDALRPKSLKGTKVKKWKRIVRANRNRRTRKRKAELSRDRAKFVRNVIDGNAARARPHAAALLPRSNEIRPPGRWFGLLVAMSGDEHTMAELCALFDRDRATTQATVTRYMIARGLVERRPNPAARYGQGQAARRYCNANRRPFANRWLYRRTEQGEAVANGAEWRTQRTYKRYRYRKLRQAAALAAKSGSG